VVCSGWVVALLTAQARWQIVEAGRASARDHQGRPALPEACVHREFEAYGQATRAWASSGWTHYQR
jgi:hypothetical protein